MDVIKNIPKFAEEGSYVSPEGEYHDGDTIYDKVNNQGYRMRRANLEQETEGGQKQTEWLNSVVRGSKPVVKTDGVQDGFGRFLSRDFIRTPSGDVDLNLLSFASGQATWDESFGSHGINEDELGDYSAYSRRTYRGAAPKFTRKQWVQTNTADDIKDRKYEIQDVEKSEVDDFDIKHVEKQMKYLEFMRDSYDKGVIEKDQWLSILGRTMTGNSGKRIHAVNWWKNQSGKESAVTSIDEEIKASETGRTSHVNAPLHRDGVTIAGTLRSITGISTDGETTKLESGLHILNPVDHLNTFAGTVKANLDKRKVEGVDWASAIKHLSVKQQMHVMDLKKTRGDSAAINAISNMDKATEHEITQSQTGPWEGLAYMGAGAIVNPLTAPIGVASSVVLKEIGAVSAKYLPRIAMETIAKAESSTVAQSLIGRTVKTSVTGGIHAGTFAGIASTGNYLEGVNPEFTIGQQSELMLGMAEMGLMFGAGGHLLGEGIGKYKAMRAEKKAAREALAIDVKSIDQINESIAKKEQAEAEEADRKPAEKKTPEEKVADKVAEIKVVQAEHEADLVDAVQTEAELMQEVMTVPEPTIEPTIMSDLGLPEEASVEGENVADYTAAFDEELKAGDTVTNHLGEEATVKGFEERGVILDYDGVESIATREDLTKVEPKAETVEQIKEKDAVTVAMESTEVLKANLALVSKDLAETKAGLNAVGPKLKTEFLPEEPKTVTGEGVNSKYDVTMSGGQPLGVLDKIGNKLHKLNADVVVAMTKKRDALSIIYSHNLRELNKIMNKIMAKGLTSEEAALVNSKMNGTMFTREIDVLDELENDGINAAQNIHELNIHFENEGINGYATKEILEGMKPKGKLGGVAEEDLQKKGLITQDVDYDGESTGVDLAEDSPIDTEIAPEDSAINSGIKEADEATDHNEKVRLALINRMELTEKAIDALEENFKQWIGVRDGKPYGGVEYKQAYQNQLLAAQRLHNARELMHELERLAGIFVNKMEALEAQEKYAGVDARGVLEGAVMDLKDELSDHMKTDTSGMDDLQKQAWQSKLAVLTQNLKISEGLLARAEKRVKDFEKKFESDLKREDVKKSKRYEKAKSTYDMTSTELAKERQKSEELVRMEAVRDLIGTEFRGPDYEYFKVLFDEEVEFGTDKMFKEWMDKKIDAEISHLEANKRDISKQITAAVEKDLGEKLPEKGNKAEEEAFRLKLFAHTITSRGTVKWDLTGKGGKKYTQFGEKYASSLKRHTERLQKKFKPSTKTTITPTGETRYGIMEMGVIGEKESNAGYRILDAGQGKFNDPGNLVATGTRGELALKDSIVPFEEPSAGQSLKSQENFRNRVFNFLDGKTRNEIAKQDNRGESRDSFWDQDVRSIDPMADMRIPTNKIARLEDIRNVLFGEGGTEGTLKFTVDAKTGKMTVEGEAPKDNLADIDKRQVWPEGSKAWELHKEYQDWRLLEQDGKLPNRGRDFSSYLYEQLKELNDSRFDNPNYSRISNELSRAARMKYEENLRQDMERNSGLSQEDIDRHIAAHMEGKKWAFEPTTGEVLGKYEQDLGDYKRGFIEKEHQTKQDIKPKVFGVLPPVKVTRYGNVMKLNARSTQAEKSWAVHDLTKDLEKVLEEKVELETEEAFNARGRATGEPATRKEPMAKEKRHIKGFLQKQKYTSKKLTNAEKQKARLDKMTRHAPQLGEKDPRRQATEKFWESVTDEAGEILNRDLSGHDWKNKNWGGANKESFNIIENKVINEMARLQEEAMKKQAAEFEANKKPKKKKFKPETKRTRAEAERKRLQKEGIVADKTFIEALSEAIEATDGMLKEEQKIITEQAKIDIAEGGSETWSANELIEFRENLEKAIDIEKLIKGKETEVLVIEVDLGKTNADIAEETTTAVSETKPPCK